MKFGVSPNSVILHDAQTRQWLWFQEPVQIHGAFDVKSVLALVEQVEQEVQAQGLYAAGFVAYEAAPAFDSAFVTQPARGFPLVWFGLYRPPEVVTLPALVDAVSSELSWQRSISEQAYRAALDQVKQQIRRGETYQVNYSFRLRTSMGMPAWDFFRRMIQAQGDGYGAFVETEEWAIASASPELFFQRTGRELISRPMKGTAPRGLSSEDDRAQATWLRQSVKNQAENLMIVDMVRNDMGQIADIGSVTVPHLFEVEQYPTLWQMTSTVRCTTNASLTNIFRALFPAASITGAPKARTMEIIAALETSPRQIYTGTIGYVKPNGDAQFNVAIRTVLCDRPIQSLPQAEYGVGGGVVWDSENSAEFQECCTKARILTHCPPEFDLLETLLWTPQDGYFLLDRHLQRLRESARYFGRAVEAESMRWECDRLSQTLIQRPHKVRLMVQESGEVKVEVQPLEAFVGEYAIALAPHPIDANDPFLYHKTTHRPMYQQALAEVAPAQDALLGNDRGELTESCIANLVVEWEGQLVTPPISCGLLPGVYRSYLLEQGKISERVIRVDDLPQCSRLFLINSVRGMWEIRVPVF